jgi:xanthine dehydrogenase accessory factor
MQEIGDQRGERRLPVYLFGAGHVARALVRQLLPLGAAITWIDTRDDAFAGVDVDGLQTLVTDTPESEVADAPPGSYFVIMTHSHALDFALCEAVFKRRDFAYFGLIGSRSKRVSFTHRLLDRGLAHDRLDEMTCPIGIPGIVGKEPAAIALAVAAEIMQIHGTRRLLADAGRPRVATPVAPSASGRPYRNSLPE